MTTLDDIAARDAAGEAELDERMDEMLARAVAVARRGPLAKPNATDRKIVDAAKPEPKP